MKEQYIRNEIQWQVVITRTDYSANIDIFERIFLEQFPLCTQLPSAFTLTSGVVVTHLVTLGNTY